MKRKGYYLCSLLVMIFVFLSCRDEEQDCTQAMQDIQNQLKENDLLYFPIPQAEVDANLNLEQKPEWR